MTREKLDSEMDGSCGCPGVTNIWTQPIINRIEMLSTGMRSQVGRKDLRQRLADDWSKLRGEIAETY